MEVCYINQSLDLYDYDFESEYHNVSTRVNTKFKEYKNKKRVIQKKNLLTLESIHGRLLTTVSKYIIKFTTLHRFIIYVVFLTSHIFKGILNITVMLIYLEQGLSCLL